jgi:hypothetical protein
VDFYPRAAGFGGNLVSKRLLGVNDDLTTSAAGGMRCRSRH